MADSDESDLADDAGYKLLALLTDPKSWETVTLATLETKLKSRFRDPEVAIHPALYGGDIACLEWSKAGWRMWLFLESDEVVLEESVQIADTAAAGRKDAPRIAAARVRIELASQADADMEYFDDYCTMMQTLESIPGVVLFDPYEGELLTD